MILSQHLGDTKTYSLPLTWEGVAFEPDENWVHLFTAKRRSDDPDTDAVFQKASGAGITVTESTLTLSVLRPDTVEETPGTLLCDVQSTHISTGETRTSWTGRLSLLRDISQESESSVPINTTEDPYPMLVPGWEVVTLTAAEYEALTPEEQADTTKIYAIIE